jgi:hypothetical protein
MRSTSPTPGYSTGWNSAARLRATARRGRQAVDLARGDELAQALVQLVHHEAVEADAAVEQPVEGGHRDAGHHALAQGLDVVAVDLALEHRAFAEPAARRHAGEGDGHALRAVVAHLQQAVEHAEPVGHRAAPRGTPVRPAPPAPPQVGQHPFALLASSCSSQGMPPVRRRRRGASARAAPWQCEAAREGVGSLIRPPGNACQGDPKIVVVTTTWRQSCAQNPRPLRPPMKETPGADDLSPPDARPRQGAPRRAGLREKEYGIWQTTTWAGAGAAGARLACGLAAGRRQARRPCGGGRREPPAPVRLRCWPRSRWAPCRCRCTRTPWPRVRLPDQQRRGGFAIVEDQEQVDKMLEVREQLPAAQAHLVRRPARPAQLRRAGPGQRWTR